MDSSVYKRMFKTENDHWWFKGRRDIIDSFLQRIPLNDKAQILDVGTCTGYNLNLLDKYGKAEGIEHADEALDFCKINNVQNVYKGDVVNYKTDKKYNLVTAFDVIEHIQQDDMALANIHKLTEKDGYMLVTVPALPFMWSSHDILHQHYRRYTKDTLKATLEKHGFRIQELKYFNSILFPLAFIERSILKIFNKMGFMKKSTDYVHIPEFINNFLSKILGFESRLLKAMSFPIGLSLICIAQKI